MSFKTDYSFEKRKAESDRVRQKYPDRVPVICEKDSRTSGEIELTKTKFLVPDSLTVGQFIYVIRKRIRLSPDKALFLFVNNILPPSTALMSTIYEENKEDDNFLYSKISLESTFG